MATDTGTSSLEAGAELERTLDRLEALQLSMRTHRTSPRFELWWHDLRETRETRFRLIDPAGQGPSREGS